MGKEEKRSAADKRHYVLIGYVAICVAMIFMTLVLAFTADTPVAQATETFASPRSSLQLTLDADYATVAPTQRQSAQPEATRTPTRGGS
mgnify:CR=1 FL=1